MFVNDILRLWKNVSEKDRKDVILNNYKLDGIYVLVHKDLTFDVYSNKNMTTSQKDMFALYDYYSNYLSSNKAIGDKNIFSAISYTFFIKIISIKEKNIFHKDVMRDKYFNILEQVYDMPLCEDFISFLENSHMQVMDEVLKQKLISIKDWEKNKNSLKFYYEEDISAYQQEYEKYLKKSIFNKNPTPFERNGILYGVPCFSNSYDAKKPFITPQTMPCVNPFLCSFENAIMLKDISIWLYNSKGNLIDIAYDDDFIPCSNKSNYGYKIQIEREKGNPKIKSFNTYNIDDSCYKKYKWNTLEDELFGKNTLSAMDLTVEDVLSYIFFPDENYAFNIVHNKYNTLSNNYLNTNIDIKLIKNSDILNIFRKNQYKLYNAIAIKKDIDMKFFEEDLSKIIQYRMLDVLMNANINNRFHSIFANFERIRLNLLNTYNYKGDKIMIIDIQNMQDTLISKLDTNTESSVLENDKEYYFLMGQFMYYLAHISTRETKKYMVDILRVNNNKKAKMLLESMIKKNGHQMSCSFKVNNTMAFLRNYETNNFDRDSLAIGLTVANNIFLKKKNDDDEDDEE